MRLLSNKDSPLFNNLTDNQVLFIKDFFHPTQTPLRDFNFKDFSAKIPDVLNNKIRRAIKPLRTDVVDAKLTPKGDFEGTSYLSEEYQDTGVGFDLDTLKEYTGSSMYNSFQEGLPTRNELISSDKLASTHYFYKMEETLDDLMGSQFKNKAQVLRSMKRLNEILITINNRFFPVSSEFLPGKKRVLTTGTYKVNNMKKDLENHLYRLVKNYNMPVDKARDIVNTSLKNSLLSAYYDRMNRASMLPKDFQRLFGNEGLNVLEELTKQLKQLDNMFPTPNIYKIFKS